MISINEKKECCGCNACGDICPQAAISFEVDNEGIWYPKVDKTKCVDCGLCDKACPIINIDALKKNDFDRPECYAAEHKNLEVIFDSTSGGLFSALADEMYKQGGYVGGAVYNEDFSVSSYISNDKNDLPRLRSSKYVQSDARGLFKRIKDLLIDDNEVLICGAPCQMAALRAFLGKDYENLMIIDFVCLGINSPKVWQSYLKSYEERYGSKVVYVKSKSKEYGWRNLTQKTILENGEEIFETKDNNSYTKGYVGTHLYCRPSCYDCQFKGFPRISDITLADFWGIEKYNSNMDKNIGTSLVLINSEKGKRYFERTKKRINFIPMPFETILQGNRALTKPLTASGKDRSAFFQDIDTLPFDDVIKKYSDGKKHGCKKWIRNILKSLRQKARYAKKLIRTTRMNPRAIYQTIRYNRLSDILSGKGIWFTPHCVVNIASDAEIIIDGLMIFGDGVHFPSSSLESRLFVGKKSKLSVLGDVNLSYGADIEVLPGRAHLIFRGKKLLGSGANIGCTIVCGDRIDIGNDVMIGRNVLIRDNNGDHYINRRGYKNSRPVNIGTKAWLCESCTILPGVKIGNGAIVGAKSVVIKNVPAHSMVFGTPAEVVDTDVLWKY